MLLILFFYLISPHNALSSGTNFCDALGHCALQSSGAYNDSNVEYVSYWHEDPAYKGVLCPWGMHKVAHPTRTDAYHIGTADFGENGTTSYIPGQLLDIHVRVLDPNKKFLGILMYAVQDDGEIGPEGCPSPGCNGMDEVIERLNFLHSLCYTDNTFVLYDTGYEKRHLSKICRYR